MTLYVDPAVSPSIVQVVPSRAVQVRVGVPEAVAVYDVIAEELSAGAVHDTAIVPAPATPETPDGASGTDTATAASVASVAGDCPATFVAVTANRYDTPGVSPVIVHVFADGTTTVYVHDFVPSPTTDAV